jgi:hypothetical protein
MSKRRRRPRRKNLERPTGKWVTAQDLRSNIVIEAPCPDPNTGIFWQIKFASREVEQYRAVRNGYLVTDMELIQALYLALATYHDRHGKMPEVLEQKMEYPFMWFRPMLVGTHRNMHIKESGFEMQVPGPIKVVIFLAEPRIITTAKST